MVETGGLEDRYTRKCFGGSSPLPSTNSFRLALESVSPTTGKAGVTTLLASAFAIGY